MATSPAHARQFQDVFSSVIVHTSALNPASLADAAGATEVIAVPGAALGDFVLASMSVDVIDVTVTAYVQAAGLVEVRFQNESTGTRDIAAGTLRLAVLKPNPAAFI